MPSLRVAEPTLCPFASFNSNGDRFFRGTQGGGNHETGNGSGDNVLGHGVLLLKWSHKTPLPDFKSGMRGPMLIGESDTSGSLTSSKRGDRAVIERLREEALGFLDFYWPGDRVLKIPFDSCEFRD